MNAIILNSCGNEQLMPGPCGNMAVNTVRPFTPLTCWGCNRRALLRADSGCSIDVSACTCP